MKRIQNLVFQDLVRVIKSREAGRKPILLLGSGCSVYAGMPSLEQLLGNLQAKDLDALLDRLDSDVLARVNIAHALGDPHDTSAHEMLACLIAKGHFDTILTTNWDFLIETSLAHFLPPSQYRVYVRPEVSDSMIAEALNQAEPRVKVVKLHGDTMSQLIGRAKGLCQIGEPLKNQLAEMIRRDNIIIIGYALKEYRWFAIMDKANAKPIIVNPSPFLEQELDQFGVGAKQFHGQEGRFENFVQGLCYELLGESYRDMTEVPQDHAGGALWAFPKEKDRRKVHDICTGIAEAVTETNFPHERVPQLVTDLLGRIVSTFKHLLKPDKNGVLLVFLHDPSAPGGSEIRSIIALDPALNRIAGSMAQRTLEFARRDGGPRRIDPKENKKDWKDLTEFGAVVLIDSVSFTGNTLEVARRYLCKHSKRKPSDFAAALLLLPGWLEKELKEGTPCGGSSWHEDRYLPWNAVICPNADYREFEATFPWGWTAATKPILAGGRKDKNGFNPRSKVSYIPKPWGEQYVFSANEHISVSLLMLNRGERTSTHFHLCRDETFFILDTHIRICVWDRYIELRKHESARIPAGVPHSLIALDQPCRVLEIAEGYSDLKRDIVRVHDIYKREPCHDGGDHGLR